MNIYQYTCAHGISYWITEQNSRITLWTKSYNNLELIGFFSAPYHPQNNGKLMSSTNTWHPTLKKLCEIDPANWVKYSNQVLTSYRITPNLATAETPFFLVYNRDPSLPPTPTARTHAICPRRP